MPNAKDDICLIHGCDRPVRARGLCSGCYSTARNAIHSGKCTEEELVNQGLMLPSVQGRRPGCSPMTRAMSEVGIA